MSFFKENVGEVEELVSNCGENIENCFHHDIVEVTILEKKSYIVMTQIYILCNLERNLNLQTPIVFTDIII